jgi:hypothetical protein
MSLETWKREYYPVPAHEVPAGRPAVWHSLRKWGGMRPGNLAKHGCYIDRHDDVSDMGSISLVIGSESCALCEHYLVNKPYSSGTCKGCPLYKANHHRRCDDGDGSPWRQRHRTVEPMISILKRALKHV